MMKEQIQKIVDDRAKSAQDVAVAVSEWKKRLKDVEAKRRKAIELRRVCERAIERGAADAPFQELVRSLDEIERGQMLHKMQADCSYALDKLEKLNLRFNRKTINIAVAGVGRCGKSTALKAIIGQEQGDNSTIPSGNGPAITAGKSTIRCVLTAEEEKTVVRYHTVESFLGEVINPLLQSISLSGYQCNALDDVEAMNIEELRQSLEMMDKESAEDVKRAELDVHQADDKITAQKRLQQAKAYATSFNVSYERLNDLKDILAAFPHFKTRLTGGYDTVPLNQTSRYVSYPRQGEPAICYAVKECCIYSRFPNNEVQSLELTDLPGLGTGSQSEKKCFLEGFNYAVDLALMIRRPEGLFQNFTTEDDLRVMDVLGETFGTEHLHECMVLFQNDANLQQANIDLAYERIVKWNRQRKDAVTVFRGNAFDSDFMQRKLLPQVLDFILEHLPRLDDALKNDVLAELGRFAEEFDSQRSKICEKLVSVRHMFPRSDGSNAVNGHVNDVKDKLMNALMERIEHYDNKFDGKDLTDEVDRLTADAKAWVNERYAPRNGELVARIRNQIRADQSAIPCAIKELHAIRIHVGEVYSELEPFHGTLIAEMQRSVAGVLRMCFPFLMSEGDGLERFVELTDQTGECPIMVDSVRVLTSLKVPFYSTIYPDMRKEVFDSVSSLANNFKMEPGWSVEKQAETALQELQNIGINWIWKTQELLNSQYRIPKIISASLERFLDRMIRNDETRREMVDLVERFWSKIQNDAAAYHAAVRAMLERF